MYISYQIKFYLSHHFLLFLISTFRNNLTWKMVSFQEGKRVKSFSLTEKWFAFFIFNLLLFVYHFLWTGVLPGVKGVGVKRAL